MPIDRARTLAGPFWLAAALCAAVVWMGRSLPVRVGDAAVGEAAVETAV